MFHQKVRLPLFLKNISSAFEGRKKFNPVWMFSKLHKIQTGVSFSGIASHFTSLSEWKLKNIPLCDGAAAPYGSATQRNAEWNDVNFWSYFFSKQLKQDVQLLIVLFRKQLLQGVLLWIVHFFANSWDRVSTFKCTFLAKTETGCSTFDHTFLANN